MHNCPECRQQCGCDYDELWCEDYDECTHYLTAECETYVHIEAMMDAASHDDCDDDEETLEDIAEDYDIGGGD